MRPTQCMAGGSRPGCFPAGLRVALAPKTGIKHPSPPPLGGFCHPHHPQSCFLMASPYQSGAGMGRIVLWSLSPPQVSAPGGVPEAESPIGGEQGHPAAG